MEVLQDIQDVVMEAQDENARSQVLPHGAEQITNPNPGWPPGVPIDKGGTGKPPSFRDKLMGSKRRLAKILATLIEMELVKIEYQNGNLALPKVMIDDSIMKELSGVWDNTIIIKVLGRDVGYKYLLNRVKSLWKIKEGFEMIDVGRGYFQVTFNLEEDMQMVMEGGPWVILDHYLILTKWALDFHPETNEIEKILVWVRLPELNMVYYEENVLMAIGSAIGAPIKVDTNTIQAARGRFARVCVEVDLKKPLIGKVWIGGHWIKVEYESLHLLCTNCGTYGHPPKDCPTKRFLVDLDPIGEDLEGGDPGNNQDKRNKVTSANGNVKDQGFGEEAHGGWMVATKKNYKRPTNPQRGMNTYRSVNKFQVLSSEDNVEQPKGTGTPVEGAVTNSKADNGGLPSSKKKRTRMENDSHTVAAVLPTIDHNPELTMNLARMLRDAFKSTLNTNQQMNEGNARRVLSSPSPTNRSTPMVSPSTSGDNDQAQSQKTCVPSTFPVEPGASGAIRFHSGRLPDPGTTGKGNERRFGVSKPQKDSDLVGVKPFDICGNNDEEVQDHMIQDHSANKLAKRHIRELIRANRPSVLCILEPHVNFSKTKKFWDSMGYEAIAVSEAQGHSGGIWVLSNLSKSCFRILHNMHQAVTISVSKNSGSWVFTVVYGSPNFTTKELLWNHLASIHRGISCPWLVLGDFNDILLPNEVSGGTFYHHRAEKFAKIMDTYRALSNIDWRMAFSEASVMNMFSACSDHNPVKVLCGGPQGSKGDRPFRLEAAWTRHPLFSDVVKDAWKE
ncbi:ribonuclease H [Senna tora]|uniref:Ribonuclease H n=1 Tax=Senna tora TaxID=362788 RepID=A0A834WVP4_9FABA|nr:ribonuclease H [Senna tora]